jgi:hypothetical protein
MPSRNSTTEDDVILSVRMPRGSIEQLTLVSGVYKTPKAHIARNSITAFTAKHQRLLELYKRLTPLRHPDAPGYVAALRKADNQWVILSQADIQALLQ